MVMRRRGSVVKMREPGVKGVFVLVLLASQ